MKNKVMIDIETLGRKPGCVILEVGIVGIVGTPNSATGKPYEQYKSSIAISIESQKLQAIEPDTLKWWMEKPDAWKLICERQAHVRCNQKSAAKFIASHLTDLAPDEIWANSPSFDLAILREFFERNGSSVPWEYWQERDFRTVKARSSIKYLPPKDAHGALADAVAQADYLDAIGIWRD